MPGQYVSAFFIVMDLNEERKRIGIEVAKLRTEAGMSARTLSSLCGLDTANISKIENGKYNVSIDILSRLLEPLGGTIKIEKK